MKERMVNQRGLQGVALTFSWLLLPICVSRFEGYEGYEDHVTSDLFCHAEVVAKYVATNDVEMTTCVGFASGKGGVA